MDNKDKVSKYQKLVRPKVNANSIRIDDELYRLNEIVRIYNSNAFVSPSNADILRTLLQLHVAQLREEDPKTVMEIETAIDQALKEFQKGK